MDDQIVSKCKAKVGMLILRDCGELASEKCASCGIPICLDHMTNLPGKGLVCPNCADSDPDTADKHPFSRTRRRRHYHSHYGYSPYYYGHHRYYSDSDRRSVEDRNETPVENGLNEDSVSEVTDQDSFDALDTMES